MWKYSGDPSANPKDAVRFIIGDTMESDPLLTDEEITYLLNIYNGAPMNASIRGCEMIMAKFSRLADETAGQVKVSYSQKAKQYATMRDALTMRLAVEDMIPSAGGISVLGKIQNNANPDLVKPDFKKHMMENKEVAPWVNGPGDDCGEKSGD